MSRYIAKCKNKINNKILKYKMQKLGELYGNILNKKNTESCLVKLRLGGCEH